MHLENQTTCARVVYYLDSQIQFKLENNINLPKTFNLDCVEITWFTDHN